MNRRRVIVAAAALMVCACAPAAPTDSSTIYLVRHAEKQAGDDPALTQAGLQRAEALAERLAGAGLTHIHSSDTRRTRDTAAPIAARTGLPVELYDPTDLPALAATLLATPGNHLVVGHSNTTPPLADALGGNGGTPIVEATEYDRLYVIEVTPSGATSRIERFGAESAR